MAEKTKANPGIQYTVGELVAKVIKPEDAKDLYANYAQVMVTSSEMFLDFFYLSRALGKNTSVKATHVQTIIIPHGLAKGLTLAIANSIATYEDDNNVNLPNQRGKQEGDKITIWE